MKEMAAEVPATEPGQSAAETNSKRKRKKNGKSSRNEPTFNLAGELQRITGVDLTRIDGVKVLTAQTVLTEAGRDMTQCETHVADP